MPKRRKTASYLDVKTPLREQLHALGITDTQIRKLIPKSNLTEKDYLHILNSIETPPALRGSELELRKRAQDANVELPPELVQLVLNAREALPGQSTCTPPAYQEYIKGVMAYCHALDSNDSAACVSRHRKQYFASCMEAWEDRVKPVEHLSQRLSNFLPLVGLVVAQLLPQGGLGVFYMPKGGNPLRFYIRNTPDAFNKMYANFRDHGYDRHLYTRLNNNTFKPDSADMLPSLELYQVYFAHDKSFKKYKQLATYLADLVTFNRPYSPPHNWSMRRYTTGALRAVALWTTNGAHV